MERSKAEIKAAIERSAIYRIGTRAEIGESDWKEICQLAREYGQLRAHEDSVDKDILALLLIVLQTLHSSAMPSRSFEIDRHRLYQANTFWSVIVNEVLQRDENHSEFHPLPG